MKRRAKTFEASYKGHLGDLARDNVEGLVNAIRACEALHDDIGKLISYAGLVYAGNTTDPKSQKFYGDIQERITAVSTHLLFFTLEFNRIDETVLEAALQNEGLAHFKPWDR